MIAAATLMVAVGSEAHAAPTQRVQVDQKGDFALIGNTLGHDCVASTPSPVVGTVGNCGTNTADSAPDVFWRSDSPANGGAEANTGITVVNARSTSVLALPPGATVTHAYLYWGARSGVATADTTVTIERPGVNGFSVPVNAIAGTGSFTVAGGYYQSVADVTSVVQQYGPGAYRVTGVDSVNLVGANTSTNFAGWWIVVFYEDLTQAPRNLALFDGLDEVNNGQPANATLSGFLVPLSGYTAKLGVVSYGGKSTVTGDQFFFDGAQLSDATNPANNWFNGTRTLLGNPVSVAGDLPQLTGGAGSMSGIDIDVVDITAQVSPLQTSAPIQATSTGDVYYLAGFITSISTLKPDFASCNKTAVDVNGGALLPGDVIQYTVNVVNTGNDTSINTVLTDALPPEVTYVPGSLAITSGANMGPKTDAPGDDQGQYSSGTRTITVHLGTGANAVQGGTMLVGETAAVTFQVTVNGSASGTISNQAIINAGGQQGAPPKDTPTDGNGPNGGAPPTNVIIDLCASDADCVVPTPYCNTAPSPNVCVECLLDSHCSPLEPACNQGTYTCICVPSGPEVCDGIDNDCDGVVDEGFTTSMPCTAGVGACQNTGVIICDGVSATTCSAIPGSPSPETCDGLDNDCDGAIDDGFNIGMACTEGVGACIDTGVFICDAASASTCNATPGSPSVELCGDGIDNNCNGTTDEQCADTDRDGLSDAVEGAFDTDPNDADSDNDGVPDGDELQPGVDSDGDGLINALDPDSDDDGLFDGTELGLDCSNPTTNPAAGHCIPDADSGATTTDPLDADTDDGGANDSDEDANHNGAVDPGETDPSDPLDDGACTQDSDCEPIGSGGAAAAPPDAPSTPEPTNFYACAATPSTPAYPASLLFAGLTALAARRHRRRLRPPAP